MFDYFLCNAFRIAMIFSIIPNTSITRPSSPATNATTGLRCVDMNCVILSIHIPIIDTPVHGSFIMLIIIVSSGILVSIIVLFFDDYLRSCCGQCFQIVASLST